MFCLILSPFLSFSLTSSFSLPIDPMWVWPGCSRRTTWCVAVLNRTKGSAWKGALCCICRSPYTTTSCFRPTPHRQPCVPRPKKAQTEGFSPPRGWAQDPIHPLPNAPPWISYTSFRMALFKIHKYSPLRGIEIIWMLHSLFSVVPERRAVSMLPPGWGGKTCWI